MKTSVLQIQKPFPQIHSGSWVGASLAELVVTARGHTASVGVENPTSQDGSPTSLKVQVHGDLVSQLCPMSQQIHYHASICNISPSIRAVLRGRSSGNVLK